MSTAPDALAITLQMLTALAIVVGGLLVAFYLLKRFRNTGELNEISFSVFYFISNEISLINYHKDYSKKETVFYMIFSFYLKSSENLSKIVVSSMYLFPNYGLIKYKKSFKYK